MINESVSLLPYVWRMYQGHSKVFDISYAERDSMYDSHKLTILIICSIPATMLNSALVTSGGRAYQLSTQLQGQLPQTTAQRVERDGQGYSSTTRLHRDFLNSDCD